MSELAAQLVEHVIPNVPVRQWVLSLPWSLRYQLAFDAALCRQGRVYRCRVPLVASSGGREGMPDGQCGAITVIQRAGSALNLNVHFHSLVLDGVFTRPARPRHRCFMRCPRPRTKRSPGSWSRSMTECRVCCEAEVGCPMSPAPPIRWPSRCRSWRATPRPRSRNWWPAALGPAIRCAACARRRRWWTSRNRGVLGWTASRYMPMSHWPLTPESSSSTSAATCCGHRWPGKG